MSFNRTLSAAVTEAIKTAVKEIDIIPLMESRVARANLDTTKHYNKVVNTRQGTSVEEEYVGQFIKSYRMGSGDGMTLHWDFDRNGTVVTVNDEMWGYTDGRNLVGFRAVEQN